MLQLKLPFADFGWVLHRYVHAQHNSTVTPSVILEEDDTLLWMSGDGKGHWMDASELEEIDYWGPPFDLDTGLIGYASRPNCLWAIYRNYMDTSSAMDTNVAISVAKIDSQSMSLIPMFTLRNINGKGAAFVRDRYVSLNKSGTRCDPQHGVGFARWVAAKLFAVRWICWCHVLFVPLIISS